MQNSTIKKVKMVSGNDDLVNIKVRRSTKRKLQEDLNKFKKLGGSKKIILDEIICLGRDAITDDHINKLCHMSRTNEDKEKLIFDVYKSKNKGSTWDEFKGKLLIGELANFIKENCQEIMFFDAN